MTSKYHAPGADGQGRTLCGEALEGEAPKDGGPGDEIPAVALKGGRVDCAACCQIIRHCRENFSDARIHAMFKRRG
jgi:hypothetical protein